LSDSIHSKEKLAAAYDEVGKVRRTHVGGQALIEGIMMRGRYNWALAVRKPNGSIHVEEHDLVSGRDKNSWMYKPVVRGCTSLVESLALGYKALEIAANHAFDDLEEEERLRIENEESGELEIAGTQALVIGKDSAEEEASALRAASIEEDAPVANGAPLNADAPVDQSAALAEDAVVAQAVQYVKEAQKASATDAIDALDATETIGKIEEVGVTDTTEKASVNEKASAKEKVNATVDEGSGALPKSLMTGAMILGLLLGVVIFIVVPAILTNLIVGDYAEDTLLWNIVDGVLRVVIFIGYIFLIGRMSDIKRMFGYHGAEHRAIHCYERGQELTVKNAQNLPSLHVRCGTAFMLTTMIIAIFVFTVVPIQLLLAALGVENDILRLIIVILSRILLLPPIAGLSYEVTVKWAGNRPDNPLVKIVLWPGLQLQRLTTNPPDDGMVECAIAAMKLVLAREQAEAQKASS